MPAHRSRVAAPFVVAAAIAAAIASPAGLAARPAHAGTQAERIAMFARQYKEIQHRLIFEPAEEGCDQGSDRAGGLFDPEDLADLARRATATRAAGPLSTNALSNNVRANNPAGDSPGVAQSEVSVAALGDNVVVAFNDGQGFVYPRTDSQGFAYSTNGGQSFTDGGTPPKVPGPPAAWQWDSDPVLAVNESTGEFYFIALNSTTTDNGIGLARATFQNSNLVWAPSVEVRGPSDFSYFLDKPWLAVDPASGRIYVIYTTFGAAPGTPPDAIEFQFTTDKGQTWSPPLQLSDPADDGWVQGSRVAVGPGGEVYATWYTIGRSAPYQDKMAVRKSTNGGVSFAPEVTAAHVYSNFSSGAPGFNRPRGVPFPTIAVDRSNGPHRGRLYIGWQECVNFYNDPLGTGAGHIELEPNDAPASANAIAVGDSVVGTLDANDMDYYRFTGNQGQTVVLYGIPQGGDYATLDMSLRIFCQDGTTPLALSDVGPARSPLLIFTLPATGTYYMRLKDVSGSGQYTVYTGFHTPQPGERARDHRDLFVTSTDDGALWSPPVRINNDAPWLDNWLPELAVSNLSTVYASWYDWRDAPASVCNALSRVYLASSSDGGATWSTLGELSDAASNWTTSQSNIAPNQGDYNALFADCQAVYGGWGDGRGADVDVWTGRYPPFGQPTLVTFRSASAQAHQVTLIWQAQSGASLTGTIERRDPGGAWAGLGPVSSDASGQILYVDATVNPGQAYEYRLNIAQPGGSWITCGTLVDVPVEVVLLTIDKVAPNPTSFDCIVSFNLPTNTPADLQLFDAGGRKVYSREVGTLGPGRQSINIGPELKLKPGLYFIRIAQSGQEVTSRIAIVK